MKETLFKRAIELCLAIYRATDKFPEGEILRGKMRRGSIDIVETVVYSVLYPTKESRFFYLEDAEKKTAVLLAHFTVAERQNWIRRENFLILRREYQELLEDIQAEFEGSKSEETQGNEGHADEKSLGRTAKRQAERRREKPKLTARSVKILKILESKRDGATVADFMKATGMSRKTIERDMKHLTAKKFVVKKGNTKGAKFYLGQERNY